MAEPKSESDQNLHREYESDRRGEHKYPISEEEKKERPSQRERDQLKERLERTTSR